MFDLPPIDDIVARALAEDLGVQPAQFLPGAAPDIAVLDRDATGFAVTPPDAHFAGRIVARQEAVVCGLPVADAVFAAISRAAGLPTAVEVFPLVAEGALVAPGTPVAEIEGLARAVHIGERTALNFVMLLSGIATTARQWRDATDPVRVVDTRKTLPGLRDVSKYASRVGGIDNHRSGLWDMVLIKDNHIREAGGVTAAVRMARERRPDLLVQCEADTLDQAAEAVRAGAHMVLLDNMDDAALTSAVMALRLMAGERGEAVVIEASGNITLPRVAGLRHTGIDRVSTSAITLARPLDFGLDEA